jgi:hypothetical protein
VNKPAKRTPPPGTLVLDSEGLSRAIAHDRDVIKRLSWAHKNGTPVVISTATLVEAIHPRVDRKALAWRLSRLILEPVTEQVAREATELLAEAGKHGHSHAIDAMVCATAIASPKPVRVLTSDPGDIADLAGDHVSVIPV